MNYLDEQGLSTYDTLIKSYIAGVVGERVERTYSDIQYSTATDSVSGAVTVNGSTPLHVLTATGDVSSISFTTAVPANGHSCHIIILASADRSVSLSNGSTVTIGESTYTFKCPQAADLSLSVVSGGFVELDFLRVGTDIYVRGL